MGRTKPPKQSDLKPVDWAALTPHYQAGIRSLKSIGAQFGVAPSAILKHMNKRAIPRDLKPRIIAAAQRKVNAAAVNAERERLDGESVKPSEPAIVEANALALAAVQIGHRSDIKRLRALSAKLLGELEGATESPELYWLVTDALSDPNEVSIEALRAMAALVASLPQRTKVFRELVDAMHKCIGLEREAHGLDTISGSDGRPLVVIRDYTGRGDPDAPPRPLEVEA